MLDWLTAKLLEIQQVIQTGVAVAAILFVSGVWWRTKALVPTLGAMLLAGAVLWSVGNVEWFKAKIDEEVRSLGPAAVVVLTS